MPSHRILALNRGEKEDCLTVNVEVNPKLTLDIIEKEYLKDNEWGFKDFVPYRTESHRVWRKTEKGWDLYTPMYKIDRDNGEQYTIYQEAPKEFLTGE